MRRNLSALHLFQSVAALLASSLMILPVSAQSPPDDSTRAAPLRVMIVGGGPNLTHNQVAIESNVRYVTRLLPSGTTMRTLFADGNRKTEDVLCLGDNSKTFYRAPDLGSLDGPTNLLSFQSNLAALAPFDDTSNTPLLLYFTGHGSPQPGRDTTYTNNRYDMWGGDELTVSRLASEIDALPKTEPVTLVMVECFSGAFGNLLFKGGDPMGPLVERNICGFFASLPNRTAAGCTPEINEANYHDFTGYFFAALSGIDRVGNVVKGADYNHDGRVGMNEAFAWSLIHDESIDTPVCTSDTFLRRFVKMPDSEVTKTPYNDITSWATPAQKAALDGLSKYLKLRGDDRLAKAYAIFTTPTNDLDAPEFVHIIRFVRLAKSVVLAHALDTTGEPALKARFVELLAAEAGSPIPRFTGEKSIFTLTAAAKPAS